jgi:hypothetical protein
MDILKMLSDLRSERSQLEEAIIVLERLATGQRKRRGRPPKGMSHTQKAPKSQAEPPKKRTVRPEARKRMTAAKKAKTKPKSP